MNDQQNQFYIFLQRLPVAVCGLTLGLGALGNLLQAYSAALHWLYLGAAAFFWLLLLLKILFCWPQTRQELQNPLVLSVFEAFFMTMLQFSAALSPICRQAAFGSWLIANAGHAVLVILFSWRFLRGFQLCNVFATWNVLYGGNMLAAVIAPQFELQQAAQWIFWAGFLLFLPWYFVSAYRYYKLPVAEAALPTLCIFSAPFNLTLAGYLSCTTQPYLPLAIAFAVIGQAAYLFVLCQLPRILRLPFYPSYGALTFPFVIPAVALQKLLHTLAAANILLPAVWHTLVLAEEAIAIGMVTYAALRYGQFFWRTFRAQP